MAIKLDLDIRLSNINLALCTARNIQLRLLRLDQIHPAVSGNKWFKLHKYIEMVQEGRYAGIITFGGAYSNHLVATAAACSYHNIPCTGFVRGLEGSDHPTESLQECRQWHMELQFLSRAAYARKNDPEFLLQLQAQYPAHLIIPEGGYGIPGIAGAGDIYAYIPEDTDLIALPVGSGTTIIGIINRLQDQQQAMGFAAIRQGDYLKETIRQHCNRTNWQLETEYHFGGFGKHKPELLNFIRNFRQQQGITLDFVYTAKMMYGLLESIEKYQWQDKKIVALHTGGLQGNSSIQHLLP
ncbi:MAG: pyridoxal-phosphate dependent enzyme [Sphingobacteriales bacterium]|nr:MAG: pyridoxal-phosphate dependent enzyme [Sphingobacteriales bacterium]